LVALPPARWHSNFDFHSILFPLGFLRPANLRQLRVSVN
jgi:hypothetical protein